MGWSDRKYVVESGGLAGGRPIATVWLIVINVAISLFLWVVGGGAFGSGTRRVIDVLALSIPDVLDFEIWRLLSAAFLHGGVRHLVGNMFMLVVIGMLLEPSLGSRRFVLLYLGLAVASTAGYFVEYAIRGGVLLPSIGASGAVMGVAGFLGVRHPFVELRIWGLLPMRCWVLVTLLVGLDFLGMAASPEGDGTAHSIHLAGAFFGAGWAAVEMPVLDRVATWRRRRQIEARQRVVRDQAQDSLEMDRILQKVHEQGMGALSASERKFLLGQSERLKGKDNHRV